MQQTIKIIGRQMKNFFCYKYKFFVICTKKGNSSERSFFFIIEKKTESEMGKPKWRHKMFVFRIKNQTDISKCHHKLHKTVYRMYSV